MAKFFHLVPPVVASLALAPAFAQTVSISFSAQAPLSAQMTVGTMTAQSTLPAGPLPLNSSIAAAPTPGAIANTSWYTSLEGFAVLTNQINSGAATSASGSLGPNEIVVSFTATAPVGGWLEVTRGSSLTGGQPWPVTAIDFGNDGTIELPNMQTTTTSVFASLGPTPWSVRFVLTSQLVSAGASYTTMELRMHPNTNVGVQPTALGCGPVGLPTLRVDPTFLGTGIKAEFWSSLPAPMVHPHVFVFGWGVQPVVLPPISLAPCLLMPTLDVLLPGAATLPSVVNVPLPAAVRPVTFHVQAVGLLPTGLATTDAFMVVAN